jgi:YegS/Rv2252/BmrU family lipid kinase
LRLDRCYTYNESLTSYGSAILLYFFVINERAGNGKGGRVWAKLEPVLQARRILYRYALTNNAAQAQRSVQEAMAAEELQAVAVIGGDGTIHSIVPLLAASGVALAVIPAGSGNDTARGFGIPRQPLAALDVALSGRCRDIDLINVGGEPTLTALAVGFDAEIAEAVNDSSYKKWCNRLGIGRVAYIIGLLQTLFRYQPARLEIEVDGGPTKTFEQAWLVAITNVTTYGGGLMICPQATTDDGLLDICVVHSCTKWNLLHFFPKVLSGSHTSLPFVTMLRVRAIKVRSEIVRLAYGDGEKSTVTPLHAEVMAGALRMMTT